MSLLTGLQPLIGGGCGRLAWDQPDSAAAGAVAGVYTFTVKVPAYAIILDAGVHAIEVWDAGDSTTLKAGDDNDDDGFLTGVDMNATDLTAEQSVNFDRTGGQEGAYLAGSATHWTDRFSTSDRTVTFTLTTVGTPPTQGDTICWCYWIKQPKEHPRGGMPYGTYAAT